jgi:SpoVK/Ycf46/Vps4 family AAA+-type ATPase
LIVCVLLPFFFLLLHFFGWLFDDTNIKENIRFEKLGIPNESGRREILDIYVKKLPHTLTYQQVEYLASITHGYSGADLYSLCKEAALKALKRLYHTKPIGIEK